MIRPPVYSDMLQNYYEEKFRRLRAERQARLAAVTTPEEARDYVGWARRTVCEAFQLPEERTPLHARVTAMEEEDGVLTEAILFEPRPCYLASALLYRPAGEVADGSLPAVLGLCGHSQNGKSSEVYRTLPGRLRKSVLSCSWWIRRGRGSGCSSCEPRGTGSLPETARTSTISSGRCSGFSGTTLRTGACGMRCVLSTICSPGRRRMRPESA